MMASVVAVTVAVAAQANAEPQKIVEDNIADDPVADHANALE